ncbi:MAG TPA: PDZ domain-containing protein [Vicinamibacterales bacterium]|nr:PDZ domain-containing protein [Vicinamibacterales bacterium]
MKTTVVAFAVTTAAIAAAAGGRAAAQAMPEPQRAAQEARDFMVLAGRGAEIGVEVSQGKDSGVVVDDVRPDSPAEKAGVKRSDVIVTFDGERVRSVRQFSRLVQETPPGRTVKATLLRDGKQQDVQITPREGRGVLRGAYVDGDRFRERMRDLEALRDRLPDVNVWRGGPPFNFSDIPGAISGVRLGVDVDPVTDQLAQYFGAKEGVLIRTVIEGTPASRAGLKAGDVIASIDGQPVRSREDLVRALRDAKSDELTIGIVRDRKETSVKARIEPTRRTRGMRPL